MCMEDVRLGRQTMGTQLIKSVTATAALLVPADAKRRSILLSTPPPVSAGSGTDYTNVLARSVDLTATGTAVTYTATADVKLVGFTARVAANAPTVQLQLIRGGLTYVLDVFTTDQQAAFPVSLVSGDIIRQQITGAAIGGTGDFTLSIEVPATVGSVAPYITLGTEQGVVSGSGIQLYAGQQPLLLDETVLGQLVTGPIYAISSSGTLTVTVWTGHLEQE